MTPEEYRRLELLQRTLGRVSQSAVVTEALRRFLPMADSSSGFLKRSLRTVTKADRATNFTLPPEIYDDLTDVASRHGWQKQDLVRHSIIELATVLAGEEPDDIPQQSGPH